MEISRDVLKNQKLTYSGVKRTKLGNILEYFKKDVEIMTVD